MKHSGDDVPSRAPSKHKFQDLTKDTNETRIVFPNIC
jgi:hypothetical protein